MAVPRRRITTLDTRDTRGNPRVFRVPVGAGILAGATGLVCTVSKLIKVMEVDEWRA